MLLLKVLYDLGYRGKECDMFFNLLGYANRYEVGMGVVYTDCKVGSTPYTAVYTAGDMSMSTLTVREGLTFAIRKVGDRYAVGRVKLTGTMNTLMAAIENDTLEVDMCPDTYSTVEGALTRISFMAEWYGESFQVNEIRRGLTHLVYGDLKISINMAVFPRVDIAMMHPRYYEGTWFEVSSTMDVSQVLSSVVYALKVSLVEQAKSIAEEYSEDKMDALAGCIYKLMKS